MITISINKKFEKEKRYILDVFFSDFLGLSYAINITEDDNYIITQGNNIIVVVDSFFNKLENEEYIHLNNIPKEINYLKTQFLSYEIPVLYGEGTIKNEARKIIVDADIFASSFFMLTRWEEILIKERDQHNRVSATSSLAFKFNFLNKPIVNEYVELLWSLLLESGIEQNRKEKKFNIIPTHDVDLPRHWWSFKDFLKNSIGDLVKRKDPKAFLFSCKNYYKKIVNNQDPFDTFDYLMDVSEKYDLKSHFFFMSGGTSKKDNYYKINHPLVLDIIQKINKRKHVIGFHPSYNAYNNNEQYKKELEVLQSVSPQPIKTGREHFLRFENPTTWQIWNDNSMDWESTMTYFDKAGFRCGVCYPFRTFNVKTRESLNLIEKPLIVMEGSFITYGKFTPKKMQAEIQLLVDQVKRFNGDFVFLWHNSAFNTKLWKPYQDIYKKIIDENYNNNRS